MIAFAILIVVVLERQGRIHISATEVIYFVAIVPSIILHEISHGWVALVFGDDTAKRQGRLSLNPIVHISVLGTIVVPILLVLAGYPAFGWAKPVPVNVSRLRSPRNHGVLVSLAGPFTNIVIAVVAGALFGALLSPATKDLVILANAGTPGASAPFGADLLFYLGYVNVILAVFNLIPLPPLDGSVVIERLMPRAWIPTYYGIRPYTIFVPFVLLWLRPSWFVDIFSPFLNLWAHLLGGGIV